MRWDAVDDLLQHHQTFITAAMCKDMSNVSESKLMYHKKAKKCCSNHHYNEIYVKKQKMLLTTCSKPYLPSGARFCIHFFSLMSRKYMCNPQMNIFGFRCHKKLTISNPVRPLNVTDQKLYVISATRETHFENFFYETSYVFRDTLYC